MKLKKWVLVSMLSVVSAMSLSMAACKNGNDSSTSSDSSVENITEGEETGVYYYDADGEEYLITLNSGNRFTFLVMGENKSGVYTFSDGALKFDFAREEDGELSATLADGVLTLTYQNSEMRFLKKEAHTVTFESNGGSTVGAVSVVNGKTVAKPADPVRSGYRFIGWYADADCTVPFGFGSQIVTSDITLYAYWAETVAGQSEFFVDFDLGYDAEAPATMQTIGGKLYGVEAPAARDGYEFAGWWVSMYDDAAKLSYRYDENTVFTEDTTLFALWIDKTASGLAAPVASVGADTVSWDAVSGAATYQVRVTDASGNALVDTSVGTLTAAVPFSTAPAGDYVVQVTARDSGTGASETTIRYYKNKALARVSAFAVAEPSVLVFEGVENATHYYITVDCGNDLHNHTRFDLGTSTSFNFADCAMQEGGIRFTVTAEADGYASSVSRTFVYNRMLSGVTGFIMDEETQTLYWDAVPEATNYIVSVTCGDSGHIHEVVNNGSKTSFSLKECAPCEGGITVSVYPATKGYNSPAASTYVYEKANLATPRDIVIDGNTLRWTAVSGATSYEIRIGEDTFTVTGATEFDMTDAIGWVTGNDYTLSVRAKGSADSLWSDPMDIRYYAMYATLNYADSVVSWRPVVGAVSYEVSVNGGEATTVTGGANYAEINLTKAGTNTISVRFFDGTKYSQWATVDVYAHTVTFDSRGGAGVPAQYKAFGDKIVLPVTTKDGYEFNAWYTTPTGPVGNGAEYADETFTESGDIVLYAYWTPQAYTLTYDYDGGSGSVTEAKVVFGEDYTLDVPEAAANSNLVFTGWYSEPNGRGTRFTNEKGESIAPWTVDRNATVYARWEAVLEFTLEEDDTYSVVKGSGISYVTEVTVPAEYNGKKVTIIDAYAFLNCSGLVRVNLPDTVEIVYTENAFQGCSNLKEVNVYEVEGNQVKLYESDGGVLLYHNEVAEGHPFEVVFVPVAKTGTYRIPDGVTSIQSKVFSASSLTEVTIPVSVTNIGTRAFYNAKQLVSVIFETAEDEQPLTFQDYAFSYCTSLVTFTVPARAQAFDYNIFNACSSLTAIEVAEENANYASVDGILCDKEKITILYCPVGKTGAYTIPAGITAIADSAFEDCVNITEIVIPNFVLTIGERAFYGCSGLVKATFQGGGLADLELSERAFYDSGLKEVVFEEGSRVTAIGDYTFANCKSLESFTIPKSMQKVGENAFYKCESLATLSFEEGGAGVSFGSGAFSNCTALTSVYLPASVTELSFSVFDGCSNLAGVYVDENNPNYTDVDGVLFDKNITEILFYSMARKGDYVIPETVTTIGDSVFAENTSLQKITIGKNVTSIGDYAFQYCSSLREVVFEAGGTEDITFGSHVFSYCNALTEFTYPDRATATGEYMFAWNENLKKVTLGSGIQTIDNYSFHYCLSLTTVAGATEESAEGKAVIPAGVTSIGANAFAYTAIKQAVIPAGVTSIGGSAFTYCSNMTSVELPAGLEEIGSYAFSSTAITSIVIPASVTDIGDGALRYCRNLSEVTFAEGSTITTFSQYLFQDDVSLTSITIPASVTTIESQVFDNCSISTITIPAGVTDLDTDAFQDCFNLSSVVVAEGNTAYVAIDGLLYNADVTELLFCPAGKSGSVTIPKTVTTINNAAFRENAGITEIVFEEGGTETLVIGTSSTTATTAVFAYCSALERVVLPERLKELRNYTFYYCSSLKEVVIPASVEKIGTYVFAYCDQLASVKFAENSALTSIGNYAFAYSGLESIVIPEQVSSFGTYVFRECTALESVTLSAALGSFNANCFTDCTSLTEVIVPEGNQVYTSQDGVVYSGTALAFYPGGRNATTFEIPEGTTSIDQYAFQGSNIRKIVIPASVTSIGNYAFDACEALETIEFAERTSGITFGNYSFRGCTALETVELPAALTSIGTYAFQNCTALKNVSFADGCPITTIGNGTFYGCTALTSIEIPADVTSIGTSAFRDCTALSTVTFAENNRLTSVGSQAFYNCYALTQLVLPDTVTTLGTNCMQNSGLVSFTVPTGVTQLPNYAFYGCVNLTNIVMHDNISKIGTYVFYQCAALETVNLPANLTSIGANVFYECTGLTGIELPDMLTSLGNYAFYGCTGLTEIEFPESLTSIGTYAFYGCTGLQSVVMPDNVTLVNNYAFYGCTALETVELHERITKINASAFENCISLVRVDIPSSVTTIGNYAFGGCLNLELAYIPASVTSIGSNVFKNCPKISSVDLAIDNSKYTVVDGVLFNSAMTQLISFPAGKSGEYVIPETVTTIGAGAFAGSGLTKVVLPETMTSIGAYVFADCADLTELVIPSGVTSIGTNAFQNSGIVSITIPNTVTSIGAYAFDGCASLKEVIFETGGEDRLYFGNYAFQNCTALEEFTIPRRVRSVGSRTSMTPAIGTYCFAGCTALKQVNFGTEAARSLDIGGYVLTFGDYAFYGCTALESITFPDIVRTHTSYSSHAPIGASCFEGCTSLKKVEFTVTDSMTQFRIDENAFKGCVALAEITIPSVTKNIGFGAFEGCVSIAEFVVPASVTTMGAGVFAGWTSAQKITMEVAAAPEDWDEAWAENCAANIFWNA